MSRQPLIYTAGLLDQHVTVQEYLDGEPTRGWTVHRSLFDHSTASDAVNQLRGWDWPEEAVIAAVAAAAKALPARPQPPT